MTWQSTTSVRLTKRNQEMPYEQMCIVFAEEISPYAVFVEIALG
jgi:hypothetical protein